LEEKLKLASRGMQAAMLAVVAAGTVTGNFTWVPAAMMALFMSVVPSILKRDLKIVLPLELNFMIVLALFLHVVGGFSGLYDSVEWWDHLTHITSATLIAVLGLVVVVSIDKYTDSIDLPRVFLALFIVMFTMAVGVFWELMEYANDQLMGSHLQYSLDDTMVDLLFDGFGGFIVAAFGSYYLRNASDEHFAEVMDVAETGARIRGMMSKEGERN
jgi:hypothetical protein